MALRPCTRPESSENSRNRNINAGVRCRTRETEGTSENLFPRLMHDSFVPLYWRHGLMSRERKKKKKKGKEKKKLLLVVIEALRRVICRGKSFIGSDSRRDSCGLIGVNSPRRLTLRRVVFASAHLRAESRRTNGDAQRRTNVATLENSHSGIDEITVLRISKLLPERNWNSFRGLRTFRLFRLLWRRIRFHRYVTWHERIFQLAHAKRSIGN